MSRTIPDAASSACVMCACRHLRQLCTRKPVLYVWEPGTLAILQANICDTALCWVLDQGGLVGEHKPQDDTPT